MSILSPGLFSCPTRLAFGPGVLDTLPGIIAENAWERLLVVLDPALQNTPLWTLISELLTGCGVATQVFTELEPEPKDTSVAAGIAAARTIGAQAILAIGGGSAIDVAKAIGIVQSNGGVISDYEGIEAFRIRPLPLIAVPTTAGTGSEVSGAAVITDTARGVKMAIRHAAWGPAQYALLDPHAVASLPAHVAVNAGVDAFVHAFESYVSKRANMASDAVNLHAMRLISGNIRAFVADRTDVDAALSMQVGSSLAALSFGTTGLGNVHCMAMSLGGFFPVPHGLANAMCLPHVARFNRAICHDRYAEIARAMGVAGPDMSAGEAADATVLAIEAICADLGVDRRLSQEGVERQMVGPMARRSFELDYNRWNPRYTTEDDFRELFEAAI